ncbi:MAG: TetR/AcrR family transcriptional regulator [Dehalococcoidia bacterium]
MSARKFDSPQTAELKKGRIMDAALGVFSRKGYGESTVPDIAREAGVAVGTIYNYFQSKRDLLISLMREKFFTEPLLQIMDSADHADSAGFLRAFLENRINFGRENADNFVFLFSEVQRNSEVREQWVEQIVHPTLERLKSYLEAGVEEGRFKPLDPETISRALAGMGIGFMLLYSIEKEKSPIRDAEAGRLARALAEMVAGGIQKEER